MKKKSQFDISITLRIPSHLWETARKTAYDERTSRSSVIRRALKEYIQKKEQGK